MSRVYVSPAMCGTCPRGGSRPARLPRPLTTQRRGPAGLRGGARSQPDRQRVTGKGFQPRPCPTPAPATPAAVPGGRGRGALRSLLCAAVRGCLILPGAASSYPLWPVRVSPSTGGISVWGWEPGRGALLTGATAAALGVALVASDVQVWAHAGAAGGTRVTIYSVQTRPTPFGLLPSKAR